MLRAKHFFVAACIIFIAALPGCASSPRAIEDTSYASGYAYVVDEFPAPPEIDAVAHVMAPQVIDETLHMPHEEIQVMSLYKLCKVWGFTKYTHPIFLLGQKCWDEELLNLIPSVMNAAAEDVNNILYEWFVGLGDDGWDLDGATAREDINVRHKANLEWTTDTSFLGEPLAAALSRFVEIQIYDRSHAPVSFDHLGNSIFPNKNSQLNVFGNVENRLLGLFRMWNAMKYYFPHMDIIDYDWNESLMEYIPKMLEGTDINSYSATLLSLARRLDDAHISIGWIPTHDIPLPIDISGLTSHMLLENNIGLINPDERLFSWGDTRHIMETFADTDGLIIDLRQYPCFSIVYDLAEYIVEERQHFFTLTIPSPSIPGTYIYAPGSWQYSGGIASPYAFFYDRPVVILMNRSTMSRAEFAVMSLRNGKNVTVMGSNSIGANGNVTFLPLPGRITMMYTDPGIYTPDGGQTHRIGLSPDIRVEPTEEGITGGRDELMEAAVQFILGD